MNDLYVKRNIIAIDLKSFFAACECVERNLNGDTTPLVVCDPNRNGAITLAISPYLKSLGVKGRTRVYDLPKNIKIIKVPPRMGLYKRKSNEVLNVYREFIAEEDIHIYSIDEVFLDVTSYLSLYQKSAFELAKDILNRIKEKTGLTAVAGIGPNILLAKVCMDVESKHIKDNIGFWTYDDVTTKLWNLEPLSKMWGIGPRMEKKLNNLKLFKIGDLARFNRFILKEKFGILGEELWYHANGIDLTKISDLKINPREKSFSHSQVLFKDYYENNISIIIEEMCDVLTTRLRQEKKMTGIITLGIAYSKVIGGGFCHSQKLTSATDNQCLLIFSKYYNEDPIRKVSIALGHLIDKDYYQLNLFEENNEVIKNNSKDKAVDEIRNKYGKNSLIKVSNLLHDSTYIQRNKKIGGHNAE